MARGGVNKVIIIGNVGADPELRYTPGGTAVANFNVATNESWTDNNGERQERTEWHRIVVWGRLAEICNQYLRKGSKIYVEGRLQTREWEGQDGVKKQRTEIVADNMILLDRPPASPTSVTQTTEAASVSDGTALQSPAISVLDKGMGEEEIRLEEIPF